MGKKIIYATVCSGTQNRTAGGVKLKPNELYNSPRINNFFKTYGNKPYFILSAQHGIVCRNDKVEPYDRHPDLGLTYAGRQKVMSYLYEYKPGTLILGFVGDVTYIDDIHPTYKQIIHLFEEYGWNIII